MDGNLIPVISILMPVYNADKYLNKAIDSILNQTYTNFELIIINDGSKDNSLFIINSYNDTRIKLIQNPNNIGIIGSLNKGIDLAQGKYIARMDADDISLPERFEKQIEFFKKNKNIALLGTSAEIIDNSGKHLRTMNMYYKADLLRTRLFFGNCFIHSSIMGRTEVFKELKYNLNYYLAEDYFLWSQIAYKYGVVNLKDCLVKYRIHDESISIRKFNQQEECVKKIYAFHLTQLRIKPTCQQLELHYRILRDKTLLNSDCFQENFNILKWIQLLKRQNDLLNIYNKDLFDNLLLVFWNRYFHFLSSFQHGIKAIPFAFDEFNENTSLKAKLLFVLRCFKAQIKNTLVKQHPKYP